MLLYNRTIPPDDILSINTKIQKVSTLEFTFCITVMSDGEIHNHTQVAIGTGQREWSVTSLVECTCTCTSVVLNDAALVCTTVVQNHNTYNYN